MPAVAPVLPNGPPGGARPGSKLRLRCRPPLQCVRPYRSVVAFADSPYSMFLEAFLRSGRLCGVDRCEKRLDRDPPARYHLRPSAPKRCRQRRRPPILVDDQTCGAARLDGRRGGVDVLLIQETRRRPLEDRHGTLPAGAQVRDLETYDRTVRELPYEQEVQDPDDPSVHQVDEERQALPPHTTARELDDQVVDGSHLFQFTCHLTPRSISLHA